VDYLRAKFVNMLAVFLLPCLIAVLCCNVALAQTPRIIETELRISSWVVDGESKRLFAAADFGRTINELDFETGERIRAIPLPHGITGLHIQRGRLLCLGDRHPKLTIFDLEKNQILKTIELDFLPHPRTFHPQESGSKNAYISGDNNGIQRIFFRFNIDTCIETGNWNTGGLGHASISPDGKFFLGQNRKNEFEVYGATGGRRPRPDLLGKFSVGSKTAKKFGRFGHLMVDSAVLQRTRHRATKGLTSKINTRQPFEVPDDFELFGIWEDRTVFAALKRKKPMLIVRDWKGLSKDKLEYDMEKDGSTGGRISSLHANTGIYISQARMFGNSKEQFVAINDYKKLLVFDITKIVSAAGRVFVSPLKPEYRLGPERDFVASLKLDHNDHGDAADASNTWSIVKAPKVAKIRNGELFVPAGSLEYGTFPIELNLDIGGKRHHVNTVLQVGQPEIDLGFLPETQSVSHDRKHAVFCGTQDGENYETVVIDLPNQAEVARLSEPSLATQCTIGNQYIYTFNRSELVMNVYSRDDFSLIKRIKMDGLGEGFSALPDGNIYFEYPSPPRRGRVPNTTASTPIGTSDCF